MISISFGRTRASGKHLLTFDLRLFVIEQKFSVNYLIRSISDEDTYSTSEIT